MTALICLLVGVVDRCRRNALLVVLAGMVLAGIAGWYAAGHLGINTDTDEMFASSLPWRQRALKFKAEFPQFTDLLVAVIDAKVGLAVGIHDALRRVPGRRYVALVAAVSALGAAIVMAAFVLGAQLLLWRTG